MLFIIFKLVRATWMLPYKLGYWLGLKTRRR